MCAVSRYVAAAFMCGWTDFSHHLPSTVLYLRRRWMDCGVTSMPASVKKDVENSGHLVVNYG